MKKNNVSDEQVNKKVRTGPKFLTFILIVSILAGLAVDCFCAYDLLGGKISSSKAETAVEEAPLTDEELEAKSEREAESNENEERIKKGYFRFDPALLGDVANSKISDRYSAMDFLNEILPYLGVSSSEDEYMFVESKEHNDYNYYSFSQKHNGVEVYGGGVTVQTDLEGNVVDVTGEYVPLSGTDVEVSLSGDRVDKAVKKYVEENYPAIKDDYRSSNRGVKIFVIDGETIVGYHIDIYVNSNVYITLVIDGKTGNIAGQNFPLCSEMIRLDSDDDESEYKKPDGQDDKRELDVYRRSGDAYLLDDTERKIRIILNERTHTDYTAGDMSGASAHRWNPNEEEPDPSAVDALANLQKVYDFYYDTFNYSGIRNDESFTLPVYVGVSTFLGNNLIDNAAMFSNNYIAVGVRSGSNHEYSAELDVMAHEYTHGAVYSQCGLIRNLITDSNPQKTAQFGINEGLADIFGELVDDYASDGTLDGSCDWKSSVRDMASPDMDDYGKFKESKTDCHESASLITHPFYLMANDGDRAIDESILAELYFNILPNLSEKTNFVSFRNTFEKNAAKLAANNYSDSSKKSGSSLSDAQLETVIDSFDRTGIPADFDKRVVSGGVLKVFGKNNKIYDNYNVKLRKLQDLSSVVLDEDVRETSYAIPSSVPNGIYSVLLTDLADETLTETFTLVINDNAKNQKVDKYPGTVKAFTDFGTVPRDVVLVLDVSGSMDGAPIGHTRASAAKFIDTVLFASPSTRISIVTYSSGAETVVEASNKLIPLTGAAMKISANGNTNMYDALDAAASILDKSNTEKKLIVLMSDGAPNEGKNENGDFAAPIKQLAGEIKDKGVIIYTLGFFHNLAGDELVSCQSLMSSVASAGYDYIVDNAGDVDFDVDDPESDLYRAFNDFAEMINGKKYINIRVACPVDVTVTHNGETLSSAEENLNTRASFGSLTFEAETESETDGDGEDRVKVLRLDESSDYEINIEGTGSGKMDYVISYPDEEGKYTDVREFKKIPITKDTVISTGTRLSGETKMSVDADGDGKADMRYIAVKGKSAKRESHGETFALIAIITITSLLVVFLIIKAVFLVKRIRRGNECLVCGSAIGKGEQFCPNCGAKTNGKALYLDGKDEIKRQSKGVIIAKLVVTALSIGLSAAVLLTYNSTASEVYRNIKEARYERAGQIYGDKVADSGLSSAYLGVITQNYVNRAEDAYRDGELSEKDYAELLNCVKNFDLKEVSEKSADRLEELSGYESNVETSEN